MQKQHIAQQIRLASIFLLVSSLLGGCGKSAQTQGGEAGQSAPPVSVAPAVQRFVSDNETFSGRIEATEYVELRPRVGGVVEQIYFADGSYVARGQLLFRIDARPFTAEVARLEAQLAGAKSRAELAASELARAQKLLVAKAVSKQEVDQLTSGSRTSASDIAAVEAALRVAKLNLDFTNVRAPITGRVSRAGVTVGNLVNEQVVLTSITGIDKVYAYFDSSEQTYLRMKASGNKQPIVRMGLANEQGYPHEGRLDFVDNKLNAQTGAIRMRARFDNAKGLLIPGLAARLIMDTSAPYSALMVPDRAIGTDQTKKIVVVVGSDGQPQFRDVMVGTLQGGMRVINGGKLQAGENVVVEGLQRIIPGMPVTPQVLKVDAQGLPIMPAPGVAAGAGNGKS